MNYFYELSQEIEEQSLIRNKYDEEELDLRSFVFEDLIVDNMENQTVQLQGLDLNYVQKRLENSSIENFGISLRERGKKKQFLNEVWNSNSSKTRRIRKLKPSPYHNYQKHLNIAIKTMITFPKQPNVNLQIHQIASSLWQKFIQSSTTTKKIMHYIFNQENEHSISAEQLRQFDLEQLYKTTNQELLFQARIYLSQNAIRQMHDERIDKYLLTRRINNKDKFKRYIQIFRKQLDDGFLKKRFTNRNKVKGVNAFVHS